MSTRTILKRSSILASATGIATLIAAACSQLPASPTTQAAIADGGQRVVGTSAGSTPIAGEVIVCKLGNVSGTFTVSATAGGTVATPVTIAPGNCEDVGEAPTTTGATFTVTETSAGLQSVTGVAQGGNPIAFANGGSVFINSIHGVVLTFTNNVVVQTGTQGCTLGYWKQSHHFDSWPSAYKPTDSFNATFGIGNNWFPPNFTLLQALQNGGGGVAALGRQSVAALLSAGKGFYPLSVADVIAKVQAAYANASLVNSTETLFDTDNNLGCPLN